VRLDPDTCDGPKLHHEAPRASGGGDAATVRVLMSTDHLDDLRRRLAGRTGGDGSTNDRVTTERLAAMRRRLS